MRLTIKELRDAFVAGCNRQSNLSLGVSYFQDFEIASFLNNAYVICLNKRLGVHDERFISVAEREKIQPRATFPNDLKDLVDFGDLYVAEGRIKQEAMAPISNGGLDPSGGASNLFFKIDTSKYERLIPYILSMNFYEHHNKSAVPQVPQVSLSCKPITLTDVPKLTMIYQTDRYLPYLYYRIRKILVEQKAPMKSTVETFIEVHYYLTSPADDDSTCFISFDCVKYPRKIKTSDFLTDPEREIEVAFGFEIATRAIQIAMESLNSGTHGATLQQMEKEA